MADIDVKFRKLQRFADERFSYCEPTLKDRMHRAAKSFMRALAVELNLGGARVSSNKGGIAVSGEIWLHHDNLEAWIEQSVAFPGGLLFIARGRGRLRFPLRNREFLLGGATLEKVLHECRAAIEESESNRT